MGSAPSPPPPPDPGVVAAAQSASNVAVSKANSYLQNIDEDHPDGTMRYVTVGTYTYEEPRFDKDGNIVGITTHDIPLRKRVTALTPKNQQIKDAQDDVKLKFATLAETQTDQINEKLSTPFDLAGLPGRGVVPAIPAVNTTAPGRGAIIRSVGSTNFAADRSQFEADLRTRLLDDLDHKRQSIVLDLECKGIFAGSEAYERELIVFDRASNDARVQARLMASKEMESRQAAEIARAQFANQAQQQEFTQGVLAIEIGNKYELQRFQALITLATYVDDQRQKSIQERIIDRSQSVSEVASLMHGGQIQIPQFQQFRPAQLENVPIGQYIYQSAAIKQRNYEIEAQQHQQMMGGLLSLGGSLLTAPMTGGGSMMSMFGSSPAFKHDVGDAARFLEGLKNLDIKSWRYTPEHASRLGETTALHIGPMADQFAELFGGDGVYIEHSRAARVIVEAAKSLGLNPIDVFGTAMMIVKQRASVSAHQAIDGK